jgi:hypothetical protein
MGLAQLFDPLGIPFGKSCFRASGRHCADWNSAPSGNRLKRSGMTVIDWPAPRRTARRN